MFQISAIRAAKISEVTFGRALFRARQIAFVFAVMATPAFAKTHIPLEKNVDSTKCLECHEDKTKGKSVHSAMATGCLSCHEVRVNKDITRVTLLSAVPYKLCLTCHADKDSTKIPGHVHEPAVRNCLSCHDPHASDFKNQLLKATSGEKKENLCLGCHNQGENVPEKGSRHPALDMGCDTCHTTHKTGADLSIENRFHLTKSAPALCLDCHDAKDADLQKAHRNQPFATANCLDCHDPHQSAAPKLMAKFVHPPFAEKSCDTCHEPAKDGKVVLTQSDTKALCLTCHDEQEKKIESAKVPHPGAQAGECLDCHNPHASSQPGLPKTDAVSICLGCHSDVADQRKKSTLHQPAFEQGCATCHDAHGSDNDHLLRVAGVNKLCLECHGPDAKPQKLADEHMVAIFNGQVKLPENYFAKVPVLPLKYNVGHPVEGHPVSDIPDPTDITKIKTAMDCLSCHQPHASAQPGLLAKDQANDALFCANCHKNLQK
jgi:predicted CXXCH cytochrome family protein